MIFQDPLSSLHPAYKVGWQITELIHAHDTLISRKKARARAAELLGMSFRSFRYYAKKYNLK